MPSPDQSGSPFRAAAALPLDRRYGGRIAALDQLPIHALGDQYVVDGNGTVTSLPSLPIGETVMLQMTGTPTFKNSARLICPSNQDYAAVARDLVIARSNGDGIWQLYPLAPGVVGALLAANNLSDVANAATARANLGAMTAASVNRLTVGDLNTIVSDGFYFVESACTNQPVASTQYYLVVQKYPGGPNYVQQTAWDLTPSGGMWTRNDVNGAWSAWVRVMVGANNLSDVSSKIASMDNLSVHGADIASAATLNLDTATGNFVHVTGSTGITAVTLTDGRQRTVYFTGAPLITNGASLVLQGGVNIQIAAGDIIVFVADGTTVRMSDYMPAAGSAGGALAATDRQNILLDRAYLSKMYGLSGISGSFGYRRAVNVFADGFTTATGINAGSSSNYIFDNIAGLVAPSLGYGANVSTSGGAILTGTTNSGSAAQTADGITSGVNGWITGETSGGVSGVDSVGQNFGSTKHIRQIVLYQGNNGDATYGITSALVQYSDNGSTWTTQSTITPTLTIGAQTFALAASGLHQYWRILANSAPGAANRWGVTELQMMEMSAANSMVYVTATQTADASVSNARVLLEIDNTATPTLNTDLTVEVTCNGGTNWTAASLSSVTTNSQAGRKIVETVDQSTTAGTSFAARIKSFNGKNIPIYALAVTVH